MSMLTELGMKHASLRSKLKLLETQTVRESRTGERYSVQILGFQCGTKTSEYYVGQVSEFHNWISDPYRSRIAANAKLKQLVTQIGGRRLNNEWVICDSSVSVKGWKSVPWPGEPANKLFYL